MGLTTPPPPAEDVARHVEELCEYVNGNWERKTSLHLASYILWRINWIHPFADGNGRTARIVSYLVLCLHSGTRLPGTLTIPEQISRNKAPYYTALEKADAESDGKKIDVSALEELVSNCLANQLLDFYQKVSGQPVGAGLNPDVQRELNRVLSEARRVPSEERTERPKDNIIQLIERHPAISGGMFVLAAALLTGLFMLVAG